MHIAHQVVGVKRGRARAATALSVRPADLSDEDVVAVDAEVESIDEDELEFSEEWYAMDSEDYYEA